MFLKLDATVWFPVAKTLKAAGSLCFAEAQEALVRLPSGAKQTKQKAKYLRCFRDGNTNNI